MGKLKKRWQRAVSRAIDEIDWDEAAKLYEENEWVWSRGGSEGTPTAAELRTEARRLAEEVGRHGGYATTGRLLAVRLPYWIIVAVAPVDGYGSTCKEGEADNE